MGTFIVHGGKPLKGEITPQGAKNEASAGNMRHSPYF